MKKLILTTLLLMSLFIRVVRAEDSYVEREYKAKQLAQQKLLLTYDVCDVCGKQGRSSEMYRIMKFRQNYYDGEFVRVHSLCYNPLTHFLIWKPPKDNRTWDDWLTQYKRNIQHIEYPKIIKLFPFLRILDDFLEMTIGITFYKVKDTRNGRVYEIYKSDDIWQKRELTGKNKPKYNFDILK